MNQILMDKLNTKTRVETLSKARTAPLTHIRYLLFTLSRFTLQITVVSRYLLPQIKDKYFTFITKHT